MTTTASKVKSAGFKTFKQLAEQEGRKIDTLRRWDKNAPELFARFLEQAAKKRKL